MSQFSDEASPIAFIIVEHFSHLTKTEILIDKPFKTGPQFERQIQTIIDRLLNNEPIQYILGTAYFYDRPFAVNNSTLIPRQETEELVHLVLDEIKNQSNLSILDIGTGSGCIPITLKLESNTHKLEGIDISKLALDTASMNAKSLGVEVSFTFLDILKDDLSQQYDVIISNPPYVLESEKKLMNANVLEHEPHKALFVANHNPLIFYHRIAKLASSHLTTNGRLYVEINEQFGNEIVQLLQSNLFYQVKLHTDLNGKDRFVSGTKK